MCSCSILLVHTYASAKRGGGHSKLLSISAIHVYFGAIYSSQLPIAEPSSYTYSPDGTVAAFHTALLMMILVAVT
jgi:hypothetical protein